jgi:hypothetical protein
MKICHDDPTAGHYGQKRTLELVKRKYYWPNMHQDVAEYVQTCDLCQRSTATRHRPYGELQALPIPGGPFKSISMDFIVGLPPSTETGGNTPYNALLVIVDRYTKVAKYIPCQDTIDAPELAQLFLKNWYPDQGMPESIISDRGSLFTSKFWSALCYYLNVRRQLSTAFHPQSDGQTERQNQLIEAYIRMYCNYHQDNWVDLLPLAEFVHNNAYNESIGMTPNRARYGVDLDTRQGIADDPQKGEIPLAKERAQDVVKLRGELEDRWRDAKEAQAKYYNKRHTPIEYSVGELVLLSSQNIQTTQPSKKLGHRRLGPFEVERRVGKQAYQLKLPMRYKSIHNVFHVSLLEPYRRRPGEEPEQIVPDIVDGEEQWEVEEILTHKIDRRGGKPKYKYLVRWLGFTTADDQWVDEDDFADPDIIENYHQRYPREPPATDRQRKRRKT